MSVFKISRVVKSFFVIISMVLLLNCNEKEENYQSFRSDFKTSEARTWIGPEYWSNPMQDWQIVEGNLECLVSKKDRNVHVLTKKLDTIKGDLNMSVSLKLFNVDANSKTANWVGFSIGSQGEFNDYRDSAIFGKGLNIGITTNGKLFIGELPDNNEVNSTIQKQLQEGLVLKVTLTPKEENYKLLVSIFNSDEENPVLELSKENIKNEKLIGDLVLVSHYDFERGSNSSNKKSVAFKDWKFSGSKIKTEEENKFGPILFSQYTLSKGVLKLSAQMAPVILNGEKVGLQIFEKGNWITIQEATIDKHARIANFKIELWEADKDVPYKITYKLDKGENEKEESYWEGTIRKDPINKDEIVIAGFTGNDDLGFPNSDIFNQVKIHNPDVLFFSGDQIYEPNGGYGAQRTPTDKAMLDYLRKWYMYGWAYRDLMKDRPTVSITDDHDVYHGNIWGEGGRDIPKELGQGAKAQDYGGYKMPSEWVKMVERTQTSHLPDPYNKEPIEQGLGTYYTDMVYGGISFAIIEDRKFKSAPKAHLPKAQIANGWAQNKNFDMKKNGDVIDASLLGEKQFSFLNTWSTDWSYQTEMKILLSQTIFANVATLPQEAMSGAIIPTLRILNKGEYPPNDRPVADLDSNGWPKTKRNNVVKAIRKGFVFHLAGDQHLGSTIQYGVDEWNDSGYALCVPSISNHWPRRWYPQEEGGNRDLEMPKYTGEYEDGFGNRMTVHAASNPTFTNKEPSKLYDRATGYGIVRLNKKKRDITLECWPRLANPELGDGEQYDGWPIKITQEDNYGRTAQAFLPEVEILGIEKPVIQIINENTNEVVYALRLNKNTLKAKVFDALAKYTIKVGEPDTDTWQVKKGISPGNIKILIKF